MPRLAIFGAGGFGREVLALALDLCGTQAETPRPACFLVEPGFVGAGGEAPLPVFDDFEILRRDEDMLLILAVGIPRIRERVAKTFEWLPEDRFATLVHPTAYVGDRSSLGAGTIVCAHASLTTDVSTGCHAQVHAGARIGHDSVIGSDASVFPGAVIGGGVRIGDCVEIGSGSVVLPRLSIESRSIVGAGAVVIRSLPAGVTAVGNPARVLPPRPSDGAP